MHFIKLITASETLPLRQKVLKPFLTLEECRNDKDLFADTFHFGLYIEQRLVCISSWEKENHPDFPDSNQYRLRGMATDVDFQGQGLGKSMIQHSLTFLRDKNIKFVWANARIKAFNFYESLGFHFHGELFDLPRIGPHKVIYKNLNT